MSGGLLALLDDVAAIAKVAAASLDDVVATTAKVGAKTAGIVIDDAAVTPRYVVGFAADRELPIIGKIAFGSLINKMAYLLPGGLFLNWVTPWAITPLLMVGGAYLCFEGYEKVHSLFVQHENHGSDDGGEPQGDVSPISARAMEDEKVAGAIRTDMILSAEIMAMALAEVSKASIGMQLAVLAAVGIGITAAVYGAVALIVKADDAGVALVRRGGSLKIAIGTALVKGMPFLLTWLSIIGTAAMLWVGGGIIIHGLAAYGAAGLEHGIHALADAFSAFVGVFKGFTHWLTSAMSAAVFGIAVGWIVEKAWKLLPLRSSEVH